MPSSSGKTENVVPQVASRGKIEDPLAREGKKSTNKRAVKERDPGRDLDSLAAKQAVNTFLCRYGGRDIQAGEDYFYSTVALEEGQKGCPISATSNVEDSTTCESRTGKGGRLLRWPCETRCRKAYTEAVGLGLVRELTCKRCGPRVLGSVCLPSATWGAGGKICFNAFGPCACAVIWGSQGIHAKQRRKQRSLQQRLFEAILAWSTQLLRCLHQCG